METFNRNKQHIIFPYWYITRSLLYWGNFFVSFSIEHSWVIRLFTWFRICQLSTGLHTGIINLVQIISLSSCPFERIKKECCYSILVETLSSRYSGRWFNQNYKLYNYRNTTKIYKHLTIFESIIRYFARYKQLVDLRTLFIYHSLCNDVSINVSYFTSL